MTTPTYNDTNFRLQFPQFADVTMFSVQQLSSWWTMGTSYVNAQNGYPWSCNPNQLQLALDLMAAHLAQSYTLISQGVPTVLVQGTTEGSVTVSMTPPPVTSAFGHWLSTTSYGQQLRSLLKAVANVGLYVGGYPERSAFRKVYGAF